LDPEPFGATLQWHWETLGEFGELKVEVAVEELQTNLLSGAEEANDLGKAEGSEQPLPLSR